MSIVSAYTLGCKVNQYDTNAMLELLKEAGHTVVPWGELADIYLINTCTVTNTADRKSRNMIRRAIRQNPDASIIVCGCLVQKDAEMILGIEGVDTVVGTDDRKNIVSFVEQTVEGAPLTKVADIDFVKQFEPLRVSTAGEMTRGYIKIQEGCNNFCSYCIIPYVRGKERSRDIASIVEEARILTHNGVREIVLTGIHISSYGEGDGGESLLALVRRLAELEDIWRIRFSSLEPHILTEEFVRAIQKIDKLCPHFHVSLQSGSDSILKSMNRQYNTKQYAEHIWLLRKHFDNPAITTDIITGFPGETEKDFSDTCAFAENMQFAKTHVFPYSEREGTKAAASKHQVPISKRRERARRLIDLTETMEHKFIDSFVGTTQDVLVEQCRDGFFEGYTDRYVRARLSNGDGDLGDMTHALLTSREDDMLVGHKCQI